VGPESGPALQQTQPAHQPHRTHQQQPIYSAAGSGGAQGNQWGANRQPVHPARRASSSSSTASLPSPVPSPLADSDAGFAALEAARLLGKQAVRQQGVSALPLSPPQLSPPATRSPALGPPSDMSSGLRGSGDLLVPEVAPARDWEPPSDVSALPWDDLLVDPDRDEDMDAHHPHPMDPADNDDGSHFGSPFETAHWERLKDVPEFGASHPPSALDFPEFSAEETEQDPSTIVNAFLSRYGNTELSDWSTMSTVSSMKDRNNSSSKVRGSDSTVYSMDALEHAPWFGEVSHDVSMDDAHDMMDDDGPRRDSDTTDVDSGPSPTAATQLLLDRRGSLASLGGLLEHTKITATPSPPSLPAGEFSDMTVDQALASIARQFLAPNGSSGGPSPRQGALLNMFDAAVAQDKQVPSRRSSIPGNFAIPGDPASAAGAMMPPGAVNIAGVGMVVPQKPPGDPGSPSPSIVSSSTSNSHSSSSSGHQRPAFIKAMPSPAPRKPGQPPLERAATSPAASAVAAGRVKATMDNLERERTSVDSSAAARATMEEEIRRSALLVAAHHKRINVVPTEPTGPKRRIKRAATEPTDFGQAAMRNAAAAYGKRGSISGAPPANSSPLATGASVTPASLSGPMYRTVPGSSSTPEQWQSALQSLITSRAHRPMTQQPAMRNTVHVPPPGAPSGVRSRSKTLDSFQMRDLNIVQHVQRAGYGVYDRQVGEAIAQGGIAPGLANPAAAASASRNRRRCGYSFAFWPFCFLAQLGFIHSSLASIMVGELQWRSGRAQSPDVSSVASSPGPSRASWIQLAQSPNPSNYGSPNEPHSHNFSPRVQGAADMFSDMGMDGSPDAEPPRRRRRESLTVTELFRRHQLDCDECRNRALMGGPTTGEMPLENDGSISSILGAHGYFHGHGFGERFGRRRAMSGPSKALSDKPLGGANISIGRSGGISGIGGMSIGSNAASYSFSSAPETSTYPGFQTDQASQLIEGLLPLGQDGLTRQRTLSEASPGPFSPASDAAAPRGTQFDLLVLNATPSPPASDANASISANGASNLGPNGRPDWKRHRRPSSLGIDFAGTDDGGRPLPAAKSPSSLVSESATGHELGLGLSLSGYQTAPAPVTTGSLFQVSLVVSILRLATKQLTLSFQQQTTHDAMVSLFTERFGWSTEAAEQAAAVQLQLNQSKNASR